MHSFRFAVVQGPAAMTRGNAPANSGREVDPGKRHRNAARPTRRKQEELQWMALYRTR
jgi:hypothetical protein